MGSDILTRLDTDISKEPHDQQAYRQPISWIVELPIVEGAVSIAFFDGKEKP